MSLIQTIGQMSTKIGRTTMRIDFNVKPKFVGEAIVFRSESESRPGLAHFTAKLRGGGVICSCEGYQFRGTCKHATSIPLDDEAQKILTSWRDATTREEGRNEE